MSGILSWGVVPAAVHIPTGAVVLLAVLGAAELALFIWALIDLLRRPVTTLLPRWAWLIVIILFELLGTILYLALGRGEPTRVADTPPVGGGIGSAELDEGRSRRAVDMLYGPGDAAAAPARAPAGDPQGKPSQWTPPTRGSAPRGAAAPPAGGDPDRERDAGGA